MPCDRGRSARRPKAWIPFLAAAAIAGVTLLLWQSHVPDTGPLLTASAGMDRAGVPVPVAWHAKFMSTRAADVPDPDFYPPAQRPIEFDVYRDSVAPNAAFPVHPHAHRTMIHPNRSAPLPESSLDPNTSSASTPMLLVWDPGSYVLRVEPEDAPGRPRRFRLTFRTR